MFVSVKASKFEFYTVDLVELPVGLVPYQPRVAFVRLKDTNRSYGLGFFRFCSSLDDGEKYIGFLSLDDQDYDKLAQDNEFYYSVFSYKQDFVKGFRSLCDGVAESYEKELFKRLEMAENNKNKVLERDVIERLFLERDMEEELRILKEPSKIVRVINLNRCGVKNLNQLIQFLNRRQMDEKISDFKNRAEKYTLEQQIKLEKALRILEIFNH